MLDVFRKANNTWVVKILFGILMLAFGGWGIGDVTRMRLDSAPAIVVGDKKFTPTEVVEEFRRDVEQVGGGKITMDQARQFGLLQRTEEQMVTRALIDEAAAKLGLGVDEATLRQAIAAIPAFQSELHTFDKFTYQRALANAQMSENQFVAMEQSNIVEQRLVRAVGDGVTAPKALVEPLTRSRGEQRTAETVTFAVNKMPVPAAPDDATLKALLESHADRFMAPESRAVTALSVRVDDLQGDIKPSEADIARSYEVRASEFQTPEQRAVHQIVFPDREKAQAFVDKLGTKSADEFNNAAKAAGLRLIDLGQITRKDFPVAVLADPVFTPAKPGVVGPVESPLGWHVLDVTAIVPGASRPLADVRNVIVAALAKDEATNRLYALSTKLEDAIGSGASIEEAATTAGVKPLVIPAVDARGNDADGKPVANLPKEPEFVTAVFTTAAGTSSQVGSYRDGGYFVVHVDKVTPPARKPFDAVKPELLSVWRQERQAEAAKMEADKALERLKKGETLAAVAGAIPVQTSKPFLRAPAPDSGVSAPLAGEVFKLTKPGEAAIVTLPDGPTLARLKEIIPVDPKGESLQEPTRQLSESLSADLLQEYVAALRKDLGVRIDTALIDQQFQK